MNGPEFMRQYLRESNTPIILLTAKVDDADKIIGLELGADDYVTKPFNVRELLARIRVVLRRAVRSEGDHERLRVGDVTLDRTTVSVTVGDRPVDLTRSEFELLAVLMASPGRVFSRLDLLDKVSGDTFEGYERTIDVHIRNLRAKLEPDPKHPKYVQTVYGMGYKFIKD
jgi:DNA-binding response OmpR family regulator